MYKPLVSIVIPCYNGSNYLKTAIDCALNQTYYNIEIIVVNDGSKDDGASEQIALSYGNKIRYYSKENGGVSSALNLAISRMNGEWLSWLSHDDRYLKDKTQGQVEELNRLIIVNGAEQLHKTVLYCANERINADGKFISRKKYICKNDDTPLDDMINNIGHYTICGCGVFINRKCFQDVGLFNEAIRMVSDAEMWYRLMLKGYKFRFQDEVLVQSRQHKQQVGKLSSKKFDLEAAQLHIWITERISKTNVTRKQMWKLASSLTQRGFKEAAEIAYKVLEKQEKCRLCLKLKKMWNKFYFNIKYNVRNFLRSVYRRITLK